MRISAASVEMNATVASERTRVVREEARASIAPRARSAPRSEPAAAWLERGRMYVLVVDDDSRRGFSFFLQHHPVA